MTNWAIPHYFKSMSDLLDQIKEFCGRNQMAESTFGKKAVNDGKFVERLKNGRRCWPETEQKVRDFMLSHQTAD